MIRERLVLRVIDQCLDALEHHPSLYSDYLSHGRSAAGLAGAFARYRSQRPEAGQAQEYPGDELAERVDRGWESQESERRRERWDKDKRRIDAARRSARESIGPGGSDREAAWALHRLLLERSAKISTVPAGNVEPGRGGSERPGPPRQQTLDQDPRCAEHFYVIRRRLELLHELCDEAEGLGPQAAKQLTKEEKDRLILGEAGRSCQGVVDVLGADIAGSVRTVWRIRKQTQLADSIERRLIGHAVSTIDGTRIEDDAPRPPRRRVVIDPER